MTKTNKDPPAPPKKPLSGYFQFMKENREKVVAENPTAKGPGIVKIMGAKWRELTNEQKIEYTNRGKQGC